MAKQKKRTLLVDVDQLLHRIAVGCQRTWQEDDGTVYPFGDAEEAKQRVDNEIAVWLRRTKSDAARFALTCNDWNWRLDVLKSYKGNRRDAPSSKPILLPYLRKYMMKVYKATKVFSLEADDVTSIWLTDPRIRGEKVLLSYDKDLLCTPGLHCDPGRHGFELFEVTEEEATRHHFTQTLTGDTADGYKGCPGCGPIGAENVLGKEVTWDAVVAAFERKKLTEDDALQQARVAHMLRYGDYDYKTKEVKLWNPK